VHNELYADGVGEITITGTTVRLDLVSLSPTERNQANEPKAVFRQRVIMSVESFANSVDLMQKALQGLIDGGAIKRMPAAEAGPTDHDGKLGSVTKLAEVDAQAARNGSPNFN
jgi:hypothetical protein